MFKQHHAYIKGFCIGWAGSQTFRYISKSIDTNGDGMISHDELVKAIEERKVSYDTDKDGKISVGELLDGVINDVNKLKKVNDNTMFNIKYEVSEIKEFVEKQLGD